MWNVLYAYATLPPFHTELERIFTCFKLGVILTKVDANVSLGEGYFHDRLAASIAMKVVVIEPQQVTDTRKWLRAIRPWIYCDPPTIVIVHGACGWFDPWMLRRAGARYVLPMSNESSIPSRFHEILGSIHQHLLTGKASPRRRSVLLAKTSLFAQNVAISAVNLLST